MWISMYMVLLVALLTVALLERPLLPVRCSVSAHSPAWVPHGWYGSLLQWLQADAPVDRVLEAGTCWPTSRENGFVELALPPYTIPVSVSMSAPTSGRTRSAAPRHMLVQTARHNYSFTYAAKLEPQLFVLHRERAPVRAIRIYALDNWGDPRFTCFFHLQVFASQ